MGYPNTSFSQNQGKIDRLKSFVHGHNFIHLNPQAKYPVSAFRGHKFGLGNQIYSGKMGQTPIFPQFINSFLDSRFRGKNGRKKWDRHLFSEHDL